MKTRQRIITVTDSEGDTWRLRVNAEGELEAALGTTGSFHHTADNSFHRYTTPTIYRAITELLETPNEPVPEPKPREWVSPDNHCSYRVVNGKIEVCSPRSEKWLASSLFDTRTVRALADLLANPTEEAE